jgi:hypothetical protein
MNVVMKVDGSVLTDDMFAKSAITLSTTSFSNVGNVDCEPVFVANEIVFEGDQVDHPKALPFRLAISMKTSRGSSTCLSDVVDNEVERQSLWSCGLFWSFPGIKRPLRR